MHIDVISNIGEARSDDLLLKTVIVIDVLRATSTIITALAHGARGVIPVETVMIAKEQQLPGDWLGGERYCKPIPGFNLGNSPSEYMQPRIQGKRILLTTTNGTRGFQKAIKAENVLAGALINGKACAQVAALLRRDIVILCAGTQDTFSLEDGLCAGQLVHECEQLLGDVELKINDFGLAMQGSYLYAQSNIESTLLNCTNGKKLSKLGFRQDVEYCAQLNCTDMVPTLHNGTLVPFSKMS
ncbi:putative 2-phosphosulfolactate phosphatase [compost metagenome]